MSVNSVSKRSSSVAQEDLKAKPPLAGSFESLTPPRGDESMLEVCADIIADARAGLNGINAAELVTTCDMCDDHGRDVKQFQEKLPGAVPSALPVSSVSCLALYTALSITIPRAKPEEFLASRTLWPAWPLAADTYR